MILLLILATAVALLLASLWAIGGRPRLPLAAISLLSVGLFGWQAVEHWNGYLYCEHVLSLDRRYDFELTTSGERSIRVDSLPEIRGLKLRLQRNDGQSVDHDSARICQWKARDSRGALPIDAGGGLHGLVEVEDDVPWIELSYEVNESTRPILRELHIKASPPFMRFKAAMVYRDVDRIFAAISLGGALLGLAGFVVQIIRRARGRKSPIANRQSPGPALGKP